MRQKDSKKNKILKNNRENKTPVNNTSKNATISTKTMKIAEEIMNGYAKSFRELAKK